MVSAPLPVSRTMHENVEALRFFCITALSTGPSGWWHG